MGSMISLRKPNNENVSLNIVLRDIYTGFFKKHTCNTPYEPKSTVDIPSEELQLWTHYLERRVPGIETSTEGIIQENQPHIKDRSYSSIVRLLNTSKTTAAKAFADKLLEDLNIRFDIKTTEIKYSDVLDQENILMMICNRGESIQTEVDKCLDGIKEDQYKRIILIILHVTRKPPLTLTRKQLQWGDTPEKYKPLGRVVDMAFLPDEGICQNEMNDNAFSEITTFISEYDSTHTGPEETTEIAEELKSNANNITTEQSQELCSDLSKPAAYIMNPTDSWASTNFIRTFRDEMKTFDIELREVQECDVNKLNPDVFLILVCNEISRIEADVDRCLSVISGETYDKTILVVLHIARKGKEHQETDSHTKLVKSSPEKYAEIFQIIDMAFTNDMGIYSCEMNTIAFTLLKKICKNIEAMAKQLTGNESGKNNAEICSGQQSESHTETVPAKKKKTDAECNIPTPAVNVKKDTPL